MPTPTEPVRFAIVGSGWRTRFMLRLAAAAPDRLRVVALVAHSDSSAARLAAVWPGIPVVRTLDDALSAFACSALGGGLPAPVAAWIDAAGRLQHRPDDALALLERARAALPAQGY